MVIEGDTELASHCLKMRTTGWICGVKLRDKLLCVELQQWLGMEDKVKRYREMDCNGVDAF